MRKILIGIYLFYLLAAQIAVAAEFEGVNADGPVLKGAIYSPDTRHYANVQFKFDKDIVIVQFATGEKKILVLDNEKIKYIQNIPVTEPFSGKHYILFLTFDDTDDPEDKLPSETL